MAEKLLPAKALGVDLRTLTKWASLGAIPKPVWIRGQRHWLKSDVDAARDRMANGIRSAPARGARGPGRPTTAEVCQVLGLAGEVSHG